MNGVVVEPGALAAWRTEIFPRDAIQISHRDPGSAVLHHSVKDRGGCPDGQPQIHIAVGYIVHAVVHHLHPPGTPGDVLGAKGITHISGAVPGDFRHHLPLPAARKHGIDLQGSVDARSLALRHKVFGTDVLPDIIGCV